MTVIQSLHGEIGIVSRFLPAEETPIESQRNAYAHWNRLRGKRLAPRWSEIQLTDFDSETIPFIAIADLSAEPLTSTYRFWGSGLTRAFGGDFTGKSPADVPPRTVGLNNQGGCATIVRERKPHFHIREYKNQHGFAGRAMILRLPLSEDGENVTNSLAFNHFESARTDEDITAFFEAVLHKLDD